MARLRTTPIQRSGYKMGLQRLEDAFVRRDTRLLPSPFASQALAVGIGMLIVAFIGIVGIVVGLVSPNSRLGNANYVVTKDGGQYVKYNEVWHPVTNAVSARLITGSSDKPKSVGIDALQNERRGMTMGIAGAPAQILATDVESADVSVCSVEMTPPPEEQTDAKRIETVLIADAKPDGEDFNTEKAALVTVADKSRYWLLFNGQRAEVPMTDDAVRAALGIDAHVMESATVVSPKLLNATLPQPTLTVPQLEGFGSPSHAVQGYDVGTVFTQEMPNQPSVFYAVTNKGIQPINEVIGRILVTGGAQAVRNPSVSIINNAARDNAIPTEAFPSKLPEYVDDEVICATWKKESTTTNAVVSLSHAKTLSVTNPDDEEDVVQRKEMSTTISGGDGPSADRWFPGFKGRGWFYRTTDLTKESITQGPVWYISADGVRYPIGGDTDNEDVNHVVDLLGLKDTSPVLVPWQYMSLLPEGQTLSQKNALILHETIDPPANVLTPPQQEQQEDTIVETSEQTTDAPIEDGIEEE